MLTQAETPLATTRATERPAMRGPVRMIPFRLSVSVPLHGWKLGCLCDLKVGQLFLTNVSATEDVPVRVGGTLLGSAELDNVDGQMAVRLTRLS